MKMQRVFLSMQLYRMEQKVFQPRSGLTFNITIALMLWFIAGSCTQGRQFSHEAFKALPAPGTVHPSIMCRSDSSLSYSLYIPGSYQSGPVALRSPGLNPDEIPLFPLIIAFDPHGDGAVPVAKYRELAEQYGYLMVGSNDIQNGLGADNVKKIIGGLMKEIVNTYPVDTNRVYLMGFSGGARMASLSALYFLKVRGVIGCGAGFTGNGYPPHFQFDFFGMAGLGDFNLLEVLSLDEPLKQAGFRHYIGSWPGIHAWPPIYEMGKAFRWITLNAMRDRQILNDTALTGAIARSAETEISAYIRWRYMPDAHDAGRYALASLQDLAPVENLNRRMDSLTRSPLFIRQQQYRAELFKKEETEKNNLINAIDEKDPSRIRKWLDDISMRRRDKAKKHDRREEEVDGKEMAAGHGTSGGVIDEKGAGHFAAVDFNTREDTLMERRLLSFLGLYCYMQARAELGKGNMADAATVIDIYGMVEPENPETNFLRAVVLSRQHRVEKSIGQLQTAIDKGFSDRNRLENQPEFKEFSNREDFRRLILRCKTIGN
jgi:predicted esterase